MRQHIFDMTNIKKDIHTYTQPKGHAVQAGSEQHKSGHEKQAPVAVNAISQPFRTQTYTQTSTERQTCTHVDERWQYNAHRITCVYLCHRNGLSCYGTASVALRWSCCHLHHLTKGHISSSSHYHHLHNRMQCPFTPSFPVIHQSHIVYK